MEDIDGGFRFESEEMFSRRPVTSDYLKMALWFVFMLSVSHNDDAVLVTILPDQSVVCSVSHHI